MKFIVSDYLEGSHNFGKWKYSHDHDVHTWTNGERLCLWFGYGIEQDLEYCKLSKKRMKELAEIRSKALGTKGIMDQLK